MPRKPRRNKRKLAIRIDDESYALIETMSLATSKTYGDIVRYALNTTYNWNVPLTGRKGQKNYLPGDN